MIQSYSRSICLGIKLTFIALVIVFIGYGQKIINSPYSSFGMGEIDYSSMGTNSAMGYTGVAYADSNQINLLNPASLSFLGQKRPLINVGFKGAFTNLSTETQSGKASSFIFQNFVLGIPIKKNWGVALGISPFSKTGYDITTFDTETLNGDTIQYNYDGNGGSNRVFLSLSYRPLNIKNHQLSLGFTASYLFGSSERLREGIYPEVGNYFNSRYIESLRFRDFSFEAAFLYKYQITERFATTLAVNYSPQKKIKTFNDVFAFNYQDLSGQEIVYDTVIFQDTIEGNILLPQKIVGGLSFEIKSKRDKPNISKTTVNVDFAYQEWSKYSETFDNTSPYTNTLKNSLSYGVGVEFYPNDGSKYNPKATYFSLIAYRAGFRYQSTRLTLNNNDINNFGISFGLGLPIRIGGAVSSINLGAEWGQRGTTQNGLIKEDYWKINIGLTLSPGRYDKWFIKRRYD